MALVQLLGIWSCLLCVAAQFGSLNETVIAEDFAEEAGFALHNIKNDIWWLISLVALLVVVLIGIYWFRRINRDFNNKKKNSLKTNQIRQS